MQSRNDDDGHTWTVVGAVAGVITALAFIGLVEVVRMIL